MASVVMKFFGQDIIKKIKMDDLQSMNFENFISRIRTSFQYSDSQKFNILHKTEDGREIEIKDNQDLSTLVSFCLQNPHTQVKMQIQEHPSSSIKQQEVDEKILQSFLDAALTTGFFSEFSRNLRLQGIKQLSFNSLTQQKISEALVKETNSLKQQKKPFFNACFKKSVDLLAEQQEEMEQQQALLLESQADIVVNKQQSLLEEEGSKLSFAKSVQLEKSDIIAESVNNNTGMSSSQHIIDQLENIEKIIESYQQNESILYKTLLYTQSKLVIINSNHDHPDKFYDKEEKLVQKIGHNLDMELPAPYFQ